MWTVLRTLLILLVLLGSGVAARPLAADSDGIAAVVNGEVITRKQVESRLAASLKSGRPPTGAGRAELAGKVLDDLIDQELINQAAKPKGVFITEADISEAVEKIKRQNNLTEARFRASLAYSGTTLESFREGLRLELMRGQVMGSKVLNKIVVTDKEVLAYLKGEGPRLAPEGGSPLRIIVLPLDPKNKAATLAEAQRIKKEIEGGLRFAEAAAKYSQGPGNDNGGDPGDAVTLAQLPPPLKAALAKLAPGQPTEPINAGQAVILMTLAGSEPDPPPGGDFSPEARENARRLLERHKMQQNFTKWVADLKRNAVIRRY